MNLSELLATELRYAVLKLLLVRLLVAFASLFRLSCKRILWRKDRGETKQQKKQVAVDKWHPSLTLDTTATIIITRLTYYQSLAQSWSSNTILKLSSRLSGLTAI